jgi:ribose transport system permease protein
MTTGTSSGPQEAALANQDTPDATGITADRDTRRSPSWPKQLALLSFRRISALYVFAAIFLIFSLWIPDLFLATTTWRTLLSEQAITALVAVAVIAPLAAGVFDLAVGAEVGLAGIFVAWLLSSAGLPIAAAIVVALLAGSLVGLVNGLLVVKVNIDSFIATLGVSSVLLASISWISRDQQILNLGPSFQEIGTGQLFGISYPVYIMLAVAIVVWYVLERTAVGRRLYATGGNLDAARLAGVRTNAVRISAFVVCGLIAAIAGILLSSSLAVGDPTLGPSYLLPAYSAAFLGATQFRAGRFNVWGTLVSVYVLATGVKGLQLAGAPGWTAELFNGVALLIAVAATKHQQPGRLLRLRRRGARSAIATKESA